MSCNPFVDTHLDLEKSGTLPDNPIQSDELCIKAHFHENTFPYTTNRFYTKLNRTLQGRSVHGSIPGSMSASAPHHLLCVLHCALALCLSLFLFLSFYQGGGEASVRSHRGVQCWKGEPSWSQSCGERSEVCSGAVVHSGSSTQRKGKCQFFIAANLLLTDQPHREASLTYTFLSVCWCMSVCFCLPAGLLCVSLT